MDYVCVELAKAGNRITEVEFHKNELVVEHVEALIGALTDEKNQVTKLKLSHCLCNVDGVRLLASALMSVNCKVKYLCLRDTKIGKKGCEYLANALKHENNRLTHLEYVIFACIFIPHSNPHPMLQSLSM